MIDQLQIGSKYSYDDFEASVKERKIGSPKKKEIKETVPFSNITYDFSAINGEVYWEERTLEYIFEMDALTPEELEEMKLDFKTWVMNVIEEELYDPFIENHHFIATFSDISFDDSEIEKTTITVKFTAYPYMISNQKKVFKFTLTEGVETKVVVYNHSSHKIAPTFILDVPASLVIGSSTYSMNAGEITSDEIKLEIGTNMLTARSTSGNGTLRVEFSEEVF